MNERPTPETDSLHSGMLSACQDSAIYGFMLEHARRLERERDEARERSAAMREAIREAHAALAKTGRCLSIWHNASGSLCQTKDADAIADAELALTKLQPFLQES
jgi:hypothetical protein